MNLLLLHPADLTHRVDDAGGARGQAMIRGDRLHHLRKILGVGVGDEIRVGLVDGPLGTAVIQSIDRQHAALEFVCADAPPPRLAVDLLLALPRPKFLGRILQNAAAIGVRSIHLFQSARVEKSYWSSRLLDDAAMLRHLHLGLEQGRDTRVPELGEMKRFGDLVQWVEEWQTDPVENAAIWLADGDGRDAFPRAPAGDSALIIGPEGGLIEEEINRLVDVGARRASLGSRPLRVETAVSVCLGRLLPDP